MGQIFRMIVKTLFILIMCLMLSKLHAETVSIQLQAEKWDISRHGELLIKIPELATIISKWSEQADQKIELRYPGGEEGVLWVEELADWMVALGVPSSAIHKLPGSDAEDIINMVLIEAIKN